MCGRYGRTTPVQSYAKIIDAAISPRFEDAASYNRPPGTFQPCALKNPDTGELTIGPAWWGFIPNWATDTKLSPINARSETAHEKKLFAKSFEHQRCLIAADWWYEWQRGIDHKQPYAIRPKAHNPFFFAGIWSKASRLPEDHPASGEVTFAILTGRPSSDINHIHDRQPQALIDHAARDWLKPDVGKTQLRQLLSDGRYSAYDSWSIGTQVGNPANDDASIIERIKPSN